MSFASEQELQDAILIHGRSDKQLRGAVVLRAVLQTVPNIFLLAVTNQAAELVCYRRSPCLIMRIGNLFAAFMLTFSIIMRPNVLEKTLL